uniref:Uncharacterized protein n=1 Tax=Neogobius melanostomus TaxID=47308 RepID=A0A8C6UBN7_9GOBI
LASFSAVDDDLTCAVCLDIFKEPVTLGCHHSFCHSCLESHWDQAKAKTCPRSGACAAHPETPSFFCLDEARVVCPVCEFSRHIQHTVVPLEQAEIQLKQQLLTELQSLLKHREEAQSLHQLYKNLRQHSEKQASVCEAHIRAEFSRFRRFLQEEEELRLKAVREEQSRQAQTVNPELGRIRVTLASVEQSIQELQTQLQRTQEDFIFSYKPAQTHSPQLPPQPGPGLLLNQAGLLGNLAFKVWQKMGKIVQFSPVILDPNTAHSNLRPSEDLTRLGTSQDYLEFPDNPERFSKCVCVLGSEEFSSGTHVWDVEVGDHPHWFIGVAKESVDRKGEPHLRPENGFWCLAFYKNDYLTAHKTLFISKCPKKVRVQLNCDKGTVSFYDLSDMSPIHTYKDSFTEKLFPYFHIGPSKSGCKTKELRICPERAQSHV